MIEFTLPRPPSANRIWRGRGNGSASAKPYLAKEYTAWRTTAGWEVQARRAGHPTPVAAPIGVSLMMSEDEQVDLDNIIKPTLDLLQKQKVIVNDRDVKAIYARAVPGMDRGFITVAVYHLHEAPEAILEAKQKPEQAKHE